MEEDKDWNLIPLIATFVLKPNNGTQGSVAIAERTQKNYFNYCTERQRHRLV